MFEEYDPVVLERVACGCLFELDASADSYYLIEVAPEGCTVDGKCKGWYYLHNNGNKLGYCKEEGSCLNPLTLADSGEFTERIFTYEAIKCPSEVSYSETIDGTMIFKESDGEC